MKFEKKKIVAAKDQNVYKVDKIVDSRINQHGNKEYRVRW